MKPITTGARLRSAEQRFSASNRLALWEAGEAGRLLGVPAAPLDPPPEDCCDAFAIATCADGHRYLVKTTEAWPTLPLTEVLCHEICKAAGLRMLPWRTIALPDGTLA